MNDESTLRLHLGCGRHYRSGWVNIDVDRNVHADIYQDISNLKDFPLRSDDGTLTVDLGSVDSIDCNHVLEHVPDLISFMRGARDLLKVGGMFNISVPYDLSYGAWQDPTHVRAFNERSWIYYGEWCWYLGWRDYAFKQVSLNLDLSNSGVELKKNGASQQTVISTPRAVDQIRVTLKKVAIAKN